MHKNKLISIILIFVMAFSTLFSFSVSNASEGTITFDGEKITREEIEGRLKELQTDNPFEMTISGITLTIGDFILDYMVFLFRDEITIDRLVFNKVPSLNANFFEANKKGIVPESTEIICDVINNWYDFFRAFAVLTYMIVLVFVGVKILLRNTWFKSKGT